MSDLTDKAERHERILAELSELGLSLARAVHGRALAAEDDKVAADLGLAFHRIARSVRQTIALEAKLERDQARAAREVEADAARRGEACVRRRRAQVRAAVERAIWTEAEGDEAERLLDDLDDRLGELVLDDDFAAGPIEAHIATLRADLGLAPDDPEPLHGLTSGQPPAPPNST